MSDNKLLARKIEIIKNEMCPIEDNDAVFNKAFCKGWNEAFNYVFALLDEKDKIRVIQGQHPETYISRVKIKTKKVSDN